MRVIVYGAGAIGSIIGGYLHARGQETILVCSEAHAKAISRDGLHITGVQGDHHVSIPVVSDVVQIEFRPDDIVFLTMKTFDTEAAIEKLGEAAAQLAAVCFQNSVRNEVRSILSRAGSFTPRKTVSASASIPRDSMRPWTCLRRR